MDPSKGLFNGAGTAAGDPKVLQDLFVGYGVSKEFQIKLGQFHVPTNLEGLWPAEHLWLPERSWVGWRTGTTEIQVECSSENWVISSTSPAPLMAQESIKAPSMESD